jgi:hypothetical protein
MLKRGSMVPFPKLLNNYFPHAILVLGVFLGNEAFV